MYRLLILLLIRTVISFAATPLLTAGEEVLALSTPSVTASSTPTTLFTTTAGITPAAPKIPSSALITISPLPVNSPQKRWDNGGNNADCGNGNNWGQGDCGGSGGYNGYGGNGGNGGNNGGGAVIVYENHANRIDLTNWSAILGTLCLGLVFFI